MTTYNDVHMTLWMLSISQQKKQNISHQTCRGGNDLYLFFIRRRSLLSRSSSAGLQEALTSIVVFERSEARQDVRSLVLPKDLKGQSSESGELPGYIANKPWLWHSGGKIILEDQNIPFLFIISV